jgi:hypothetical protein
MRWFIVDLDPDSGPFILAEAVDQWWAEDATVLTAHVALSEEELALDPDLSPALEAWRSKDDSAYAAFESVREADSLVDTAYIEAIREGRVERPTPDEPVTVNDVEGLLASLPPYYEAGHPIWETLHQTEDQEGPDAAAQVARLIARDLVNYAERRGPRVL